MRSRGRRAPARPHRARRGLVTQVSHRRSAPRVGEGYLGFGVVGFVVVLEQQAPQQFPHLHAIRATSTRCCPDSTGRTAGGCVPSVRATPRAPARRGADPVRPERLLPMDRTQLGRGRASANVRGEPRGPPRVDADRQYLSQRAVREPRSPAGRDTGRESDPIAKRRAVPARSRPHPRKRRAAPRRARRLLPPLPERTQA